MRQRSLPIAIELDELSRSRSVIAAAQPRWYLTGMASFMLVMGMQSVLLPYLVTIELHAPAAQVGIAQSAVQWPMLVLLLIGGLIADRVDPRRVLVAVQAFATVPPLLLIAVLTTRGISYSLVVVFAVLWGTVSALAMPARDALLSRVAGLGVQRVVTVVMACQFIAQIAGYALASQIDSTGAVPVLALQSIAMLLGVVTTWQIAAAPPLAHGRAGLLTDLAEGLTTLFRAPPMRATFLLATGLGVFFAGTFTVLLPLAMRDLFQRGGSGIALGLFVFMAGMITSILVMMLRQRGVQRPGRAIVISLYLGCAVLTPIYFTPPLWLFYLCIYLWGIGGGVVMTMARTIIQEQAPASHRARVMAAYALANGGGAPFGSLIMGYAIALVGVAHAVLLPILGVIATTSWVLFTQDVWQLRSQTAQSPQPAPVPAR